MMLQIRPLLPLLLLALFCLAPVSYAAEEGVQPGEYSSIWDLTRNSAGTPGELVFAAMPAILICIAFAVLSYMAGEGLDMPTIKAHAKNEVLELGNTFVIFAFIVAALFVFSVAAEKMYPNILYVDTDGQPANSGMCGAYYEEERGPEGQQPTMFSIADYFLGCMPNMFDPKQIGPEGGAFGANGVFLPRLTEIYLSLMQLEFLLGILSTFGVSINLPQPVTILPGISTSFHAGLVVVSDAHTVIVDAVGFSIVSVIAQKVILEFVFDTVLKFFLPFGILLRAFPVSRKTGSTVIALCCVLYFVYPSSILMNKFMFDTYVSMDAVSIGGGLDTGIGNRIDFVNYANAVEISAGDGGHGEGGNPVENVIRGLEDYKNKIYFTPSEDVEAYKSSERTQHSLRFMASMGAVLNSLVNVNSLGGFLSFFLSPYPPLLGAYFYDALTHELTVATQFLTWNMIFIVNSVFITLTLFKDVSLALGGETRIFGITKVV